MDIYQKHNKRHLVVFLNDEEFNISIERYNRGENDLLISKYKKGKIIKETLKEWIHTEKYQALRIPIRWIFEAKTLKYVEEN